MEGNIQYCFPSSAFLAWVKCSSYAECIDHFEFPVNLFASSKPSGKYFDADEKYAIIMSVGNYSKSPQYQQLTKDGEAIRDMLWKHEFTQIQYFHNEQVSSELFNKQSDLIFEKLKSNSRAKKKTFVFFYFSGRGVMHDNLTCGIDGVGALLPIENCVRDMSVVSNTNVFGFFDCSRITDRAFQ